MAGLHVCDVCQAEGNLVPARMGGLQLNLVEALGSAAAEMVAPVLVRGGSGATTYENGPSRARLDVSTRGGKDTVELCDEHTLLVLSAYADKLREVIDARDGVDREIGEE